MTEPNTYHTMVAAYMATKTRNDAVDAVNLVYPDIDRKRLWDMWEAIDAYVDLYREGHDDG